MPFPLLLALPGAIAAISEICVTVGGAWAAAGVASDLIDGVSDWLDSGAAWEIMSDRINGKLADAGIELQFPPFNPFTDAGREVVRSTLERYALGRVNQKTGGEFASLAELNPDTFTAGLSRVLARQINERTGANLGALWPLDSLKAELQTEAVRQFDNRGRYDAGAMFEAHVITRVREAVAAKYPQLMAAAKPLGVGGLYGPPLDEAHSRRRAQGRIRQAKYRMTHQQVWAAK